MSRPWTVIERADTEEGSLELRQRDARDFLITVGGRVLMSSTAHRSELMIGELGCREARNRPAPNVVIGGLGMGFTLRGALDALPAQATVTVVELNPVVEAWCRGPIAHLTDRSLDDPRVRVVVDDVARFLKGPERFDAIIFDLYEGPNSANHPVHDPFYGSKALAVFKTALKPKGTLAVWSEVADRGFEQRLRKAGLKPELVRHEGGGLRHAVYLSQNS